MSSDAQERRVADAEHAMDDTAREMEEHRDRLTHDIDDARGAPRKVHEAQQMPGFAGDWEDKHDRSGGDTAEAFDETGDRRDDDASRGGTRRG